MQNEENSKSMICFFMNLGIYLVISGNFPRSFCLDGGKVWEIKRFKAIGPCKVEVKPGLAIVRPS